MNVHDRYQNASVVLPEVVEPGRYRLLAPSILNGQISLVAGDSLWDDGTRRCNLSTDQVSRSFAQDGRERQGSSPEGLIDEAVAAVVVQMQAGSLPSPVMPSQLEKLVELSGLEIALQKLLDAGHLQTIAQRPRLDMRYESEVLAVSKARNLAPDALTRLASHSEDWHRRTITGIVPSKLSALVSEDEYAIYENIVFARLIDRLGVLLGKRISDVSTLLGKHDEAKELSDAQQLDRRLRVAICTLWGQSFADNPEVGSTARDTFAQLKKLLGKIRQLQKSDLYQAIPESLRVPIALRNTNILQHDPHYQHLRPIWLLAHSDVSRELKTPLQKFNAARVKGDRYADYVELLVRHALTESEMVDWDDAKRWAAVGPWTIQLNTLAGECLLELRDGQHRVSELRFVAGWRGSRHWSEQREDLYVLYCHDDFSIEGATAPGDPGADSVLHPFQFYVVERVRLAIERWLLKRVLSTYPFKVDPIPSSLLSTISVVEDPGIVAVGNGVKFISPLQSKSMASIESAIVAGAANRDTKKRLFDSLRLSSFIGKCRVCGASLHPSGFHSSGNGFRAHCSCGHRWMLRTLPDQSFQVESRLGSESRSFAEVGCRELSIHWRAK